ncbi:hypothetical protein [Dactylosporangium sp. CS-033363]|uniref:hypothetical protein n=1 Tax=Dactylosporangium sp. CS-033363 TaxID=3239935 RepID=UPI003D941528
MTAETPPAPGPHRVRSYLGSPGLLLLNHVSVMLREAYDVVPYLVGSSTLTRAWRDVDVRIMVPDLRFEQMFPGLRDPLHRNPLWSLHCGSVSLWMRDATGLPVDFQVQPVSYANALFGSKPRIPLGIYPIEQPREGS